MPLESVLTVRTDDQLAEIARLLAIGLLRWHQQQRRLAQTGTCPDSALPGLEVSPATVLSGVNPVNGPENPRQGAPA